MPFGLSVSSDGSKVYVSNFFDNTVSVINAAADTVTATITVGHHPQGLAVTPDGSKLYIANYVDSTVSIINTAANTVSGSVKVGSGPLAVCTSPDGFKVYVTNNGDSTVSVINADVDTVSATITVGYYPTGISESPDGTKLLVANSDAYTVNVINTATNTVTDILPAGNTPAAFGNFISTFTQPAGIVSPVKEPLNISVYPNPFTFQTTIAFSELQKNAVINITDIYGKKIKSLNFTGKQLTLNKGEMTGLSLSLSLFLELNEKIRLG